MSKGFASTYRIGLLAAVVFLAYGGLGARLVWLHVLGRDELLGSAEKARREVIPDFARRGSILDADGALLAVSRPVIILGADPSYLRTGDEKKWPELARLIGVPLADVEKALTTKYRTVEGAAASALGADLKRRAAASTALSPTHDLSTEDDVIADEADAQGRRAIRWVKLSNEVSEAAYAEVASLDIQGIVPTRVFRRDYPHGQRAAHLLGYVNHQQTPVAGLERYLDFYLQGENGWKESEKDGHSHELAQFRSREVHPADGYDVRLTIRAEVQNLAEQELAAIAVQWRPAKATIIVSDPRTGFILALANYPSYDPNRYNELSGAEQAWMHNIAVDSMYEPGSVFKIVAVSGALERGLVTPATRFDCSITKTKAEYEGRPIGLPKEDVTDRFDHPLSVAEVIAHSSNKGTAQMALMLGEDSFYQFVRAFGFGELSGFPVGGEIPGRVIRPHTPEWHPTTFTRMPIGQAVAVTPLQMHRAMSVVASGGLLMRPQIIREILSPSGQVLFQYGPVVQRRVLSARTAHTMARLLWGVPNSSEGNAPEARIPGFDVAGKTGTANKVRTDGVPGYMDHHHVVSSFIGFFPADNPQLDISVIVDDADASRTLRGTAYGHLVAAPAFHDLALKLIPYLDIQPTQPDIALPSVALEGGRP
ncbi:MAG TPA: penicillin-binding protein 2 [Opitutaceae bacterium]|jgi:cell division protein FtsI/penicillin-binding protein 2